MVKSVGCSKLCVLKLRISYYVSLRMVAITRHVFIHIFYTVLFSAVSFDMGYKKSITFLVIPKSLKLEKKNEKIGLGFFYL